MKEEIRALVNYRLGQAKESLEEAEILYREQKFRGTINRLYYACFMPSWPYWRRRVWAAQSIAE